MPPTHTLRIYTDSMYVYIYMNGIQVSSRDNL